MKASIHLLFFLLVPGWLLAHGPEMNQKTKSKLAIAKQYCTKNNLNPNYAVLIDMSIHSGKKRLFLVDLQNDSIVLSGLCAHGCGNSEWGEDGTADSPVFSNVPESHCSSLGKYKIGKRGYSSWGINVNYKLHGLESTNSNAYSRLIVLHSWDRVTEEEVYPEGAPEGWGCPAVSNAVMKQLDRFIQQQPGALLMWMYP